MMGSYPSSYLYPSIHLSLHQKLLGNNSLDKKLVDETRGLIKVYDTGMWAQEVKVKGQGHYKCKKKRQMGSRQHQVALF